MTTSDKIAGPTDANKKPKAEIDEIKKQAAIKAREAQEDALLQKIVDPIRQPKPAPKQTTSTATSALNPDWKKIDWNKVQVIEDVKIILEQLNIRIDGNTFQPQDSINRYLKD